MGYGDDIMATGLAKRAREEHPHAKVVFADPDNPFQNEKGKTRLHWSSVYENNPNILQPGEDAEDLIVVPVFPGRRPYINYGRSRKGLTDNGLSVRSKFAYNPDFQATRGEFFFTDGELEQAEAAAKDLTAPIVFIEPNTKDAVNKTWPWERWQQVVEKSEHTPGHTPGHT
ncbi:MAG: hypothetical protein RIB59_14805, partial [Rhodospirillales bacterium]